MFTYNNCFYASWQEIPTSKEDSIMTSFGFYYALIFQLNYDQIHI